MTYLDGILRQVSKPARYTGGEWNAVLKDWDKTPIRIALSYPDLYEIGMSNMAIPILYDRLNGQPDTLAERVYTPWADMAGAMRRARLPLFSLESKRPLADFDVIGFSLGYELTYTNVLEMLDLAQIPVLARERDESHPLVIAGGSSALNPEPMADFVDLFVLGDGEEVVLELLDALREGKRERLSKKESLRRLAAIPGVYVPSLYQVEYEPDGLFKSVTPTVPEARSRIKRRVVAKLPPPVTRPVVPYIEVVHDRGAVEIQRGCTRGCRFCHAGVTYRPVRERPPAEVLSAIEDIVANCGYNEVSLVSLSTSDYGGIDALVAEIARRYRGKNLSLSLPSIRIDESSIRLLEALPAQRKMSLTFAPEAGSERLRGAINKNISDAELMDTIGTAFGRGWTSIKLYFMIGLPTETEEDIGDIVGLIEKVSDLGRRVSGRRPQIRVSLATFVPKPHTPFQWAAQEKGESLAAKQSLLNGRLRRLGIKPSWQDPRASLLEAVLSRGDRRLGGVILRAWQLGATFDAWGDQFNFERWLAAFSSGGLDPAFYAHRERSPDEKLPWSHIDVGVSADHLKREHGLALKGTPTPDCRSGGCYACGLEQWPVECPGR